jgi:DNA replicative helicase MCM subunit Mcm2 (Cdc46/Mcm family)
VGVLISRPELKVAGGVTTIDVSVKMRVEDETAMAEEMDPTAIDGVSECIVTEDNSEESFVVAVEDTGSTGRLMIVESRSV